MFKVFVVLALCVCGGFADTPREKIADAQTSVNQAIDDSYNQHREAIQDALIQFFNSFASSIQEAARNGDVREFQRVVNKLINEVVDNVTSLEKSSADEKATAALTGDVNVRYATHGRIDKNDQDATIINAANAEIAALLKDSTDTLRSKVNAAVKHITFIILNSQELSNNKIQDIYNATVQYIQANFTKLYADAANLLYPVKEM